MFWSLVGHNHNKVHDAFGDLALLVWSLVTKESIVHDNSDGVDTLIADLYARGVWEPQADALFDIRVVDTDAQPYRACTPQDVLHTAEGEKKHKCLQTCQNHRATFTPLCVSINGMLGRPQPIMLKILPIIQV